MDSAWYAVKDIGLLFTESAPPPDLPYLLNAEPQVKPEGDTFLTDRIGWTRIEGSFVANGGERYLTIGNFKDDEGTDTLFVPDGGVFRPNQPDLFSTAYYYVDGVSVIPDSIYLGVEQIGKNATIELYPNPAGQWVAVEMETWQGMQLVLLDVSGRTVLRKGMASSEQQIDIRHLHSGIYVAVLTRKGIAVIRKKLIVR